MPFTQRKEFLWQLRSRALTLGSKTLVMGVLNVTPDSFSDGGLYHSSQDAIAHGLRMFDEGADILDIGGESTRPGQPQIVSSQEELERVLPVIHAVLREHPESVISIDTYKSATARAAVAAGVEIVNDVSGFLWDENMSAACAELQCGVVARAAAARSRRGASARQTRSG
jgi:dihydropteroate synthase